jgi:hypothetical protein
MYLYSNIIINGYISHFSEGSTVPHFNLNIRPYDTNQVMNMTEVLEDEIQKQTEQLENATIDGQRLTPGYIKKNTFTAISSGKYNKPIVFYNLIFISIIKSFVSFVNCLCVCIIFILPVIVG